MLSRGPLPLAALLHVEALIDTVQDALMNNRIRNLVESTQRDIRREEENRRKWEEDREARARGYASEARREREAEEEEDDYVPISRGNYRQLELGEYLVILYVGVCLPAAPFALIIAAFMGAFLKVLILYGIAGVAALIYYIIDEM